MEPADPNKSRHAFRRALGFVLFLHVAWITARILELALEHKSKSVAASTLTHILNNLFSAS